jgi:hypothetical protein
VRMAGFCGRLAVGRMDDDLIQLAIYQPVSTEASRNEGHSNCLCSNGPK